MRKSVPFIIVFAVIATPVAVMVAWFMSRPTWQISAHNSPQGVVVEVYKSNATQPTYRTVLAGQTVSAEAERATRAELPADLGRTTFHDETLRPGRWTIEVNGTEIDIMERALIVDRVTEIPPHN